MSNEALFFKFLHSSPTNLKGGIMKNWRLPFLVVASLIFIIPLFGTYTKADLNGNGIPDDKDMMLGIWRYPVVVDADFDNDGVPDSLEDLNRNGIFEPQLGETDPADNDTDDDGILDGYEHMADATGGTPFDPTIWPPTNWDVDGDGVPNALDIDSDNDGLMDGQYFGTKNVQALTGNAHFSFNMPAAGGGSYRYEVGDVNTDPYDEDTDDDGLLDDEEVYTYAAWGVDPLNSDTDGDGISDSLEIVYGTNPNSQDTDGDGINDDVEWVTDYTIGQAPDDADGDQVPNVLDPDSDNDGIADGAAPGAPATANEDATTDIDSDGVPNYLDQDSDGDGFPDGMELNFFVTDPYGDTDTDGDKIADELEYTYRLNPNTGDSDGDGIGDSLEATDVWPNPTNLADNDGDGIYETMVTSIPDADGDGMPDGRDVDSDNDGLFDGTYNPGWTYADGTLPNENAFGTDYRNTDTDGDGLSDGFEAGNDLDLSNGSGAGAFERTDPTLWSSDTVTTGVPWTALYGDSLSDGYELQNGLNPLSTNTDGDSVDVDGDGNYDYPIWEGPHEDYPSFNHTTHQFNPPANGVFYVEVMGSDHDGVGMADPLDPWYTDFAGTPNPIDPDGDGLPTLFETSVVGTDPYNRDTDGDGLWDGDEYFPDWIDLDTVYNIPNAMNGFFRSDPTNTDTDGDGINDYIELTGNNHIPRRPAGPPTADDSLWASNPWNADTDGDGLPDDTTITIVYITAAGDTDTVYFTEGFDNPDGDNKPNITDVDSDEDGLSDFIEACHGQTGNFTMPYNPGSSDTDGDGYNDFIEATSGGTLSPNGVPYAVDGQNFLTGGPVDNDNDGLGDMFEQGGNFQVYATDPGDDDTDDDGIKDGDEPLGIFEGGPVGDRYRATRPDMFDTDGDGLSDGVETGDVNPEAGTDGAVYVSDSDPTTVTDPGMADSDNDGLSDGAEDANGNGAVDAGETDPDDPDSDGDFYVDGSDPDGALTVSDTDADGLKDYMEDFFFGTNKNDADTDDDGLADGWNDDPDDDLADATDTNGVFDAGEIAGEFGTGALTFSGGVWTWTDPGDNSSAALAAGYSDVTEPQIVSTDWDGVQDGTELAYTAGVTDPRPSPPYPAGVGGTGASFIADADNTTVTHCLLYTSPSPRD